MDKLRTDMQETQKIIQMEISKIYKRWPGYSFDLRVQEMQNFGVPVEAHVYLSSSTRVPGGPS